MPVYDAAFHGITFFAQIDGAQSRDVPLGPQHVRSDVYLPLHAFVGPPGSDQMFRTFIEKFMDRFAALAMETFDKERNFPRPPTRRPFEFWQPDRPPVCPLPVSQPNRFLFWGKTRSGDPSNPLDHWILSPEYGNPDLHGLDLCCTITELPFEAGIPRKPS